MTAVDQSFKAKLHAVVLNWSQALEISGWDVHRATALCVFGSCQRGVPSGRADEWVRFNLFHGELAGVFLIAHVLWVLLCHSQRHWIDLRLRLLHLVGHPVAWDWFAALLASFEYLSAGAGWFVDDFGDWLDCGFLFDHLELGLCVRGVLFECSRYE